MGQFHVRAACLCTPVKSMYSRSFTALDRIGSLFTRAYMFDIWCRSIQNQIQRRSYTYRTLGTCLLTRLTFALLHLLFLLTCVRLTYILKRHTFNLMHLRLLGTALPLLLLLLVRICIHAIWDASWNDKHSNSFTSFTFAASAAVNSSYSCTSKAL